MFYFHCRFPFSTQLKLHFTFITSHPFCVVESTVTSTHVHVNLYFHWDGSLHWPRLTICSGWRGGEMSSEKYYTFKNAVQHKIAERRMAKILEKCHHNLIDGSGTPSTFQIHMLYREMNWLAFCVQVLYSVCGFLKIVIYYTNLEIPFVFFKVTTYVYNLIPKKCKISILWKMFGICVTNLFNTDNIKSVAKGERHLANLPRFCKI